MGLIHYVEVWLLDVRDGQLPTQGLVDHLKPSLNIATCPHRYVQVNTTLSKLVLSTVWWLDTSLNFSPTPTPVTVYRTCSKRAYLWTMIQRVRYLFLRCRLFINVWTSTYFRFLLKNLIRILFENFQPNAAQRAKCLNYDKTPIISLVQVNPRYLLGERREREILLLMTHSDMISLLILEGRWN